MQRTNDRLIRVKLTDFLIEDHFALQVRPSKASEENRIEDEQVENTSPLIYRRPAQASPRQSTLWLRRIAQKTLRGLESFTNKAINSLRYYASWVSFLQDLISLHFIPRLVLRITDFISPVGRIISGCRMVNNAVNGDDHGFTRGITFIAGLGSIGLGIAAILAPLFGLIFATTNIASNTFLCGWALVLALKNKYTGFWRKEQLALEQDENDFYSAVSDPVQLAKFKLFKSKVDLTDSKSFVLSQLEQNIAQRKNQQRELNAEIATKAHNFTVTLLALTGIVMVFFPPTVLAGASILLATSINAAIFGFDLSGKWPSRMRDFFFGPRPTDSIAELERKIAARQQKLNTASVLNACHAPQERTTQSATESSSSESEKRCTPSPAPASKSLPNLFKRNKSWPSTEKIAHRGSAFLDIHPMN